MINFFEKHKKGIALLSIALVFFIGTCIFYMYQTGSSIATLSNIAGQYNEISEEEKTNDWLTEPTDETDNTTEATNETTADEVLGSLTEIQTEKQGLVSDLTSLIKDFYTARTGIGAENKKEIVLKNSSKYVTENCYNNYLVPFYENKDPLVRPVNWVIEDTIKFASLETDTPKAVVFTKRGYTQMYSMLEFIKTDGKWYINNIYDYIEQRTN